MDRYIMRKSLDKENWNPKRKNVSSKENVMNDDAVRRGLAFAKSRDAEMAKRDETAEKRKEKERRLVEAQREFESQMKEQMKEVNSLRSKYFESLRTIKIFQTKYEESERRNEKLALKLNKIFGIEKELRSEVTRVEKKCKDLEAENQALREKLNRRTKKQSTLRTPGANRKEQKATTTTPIQRILQIQQSDWSPASCAKPKKDIVQQDYHDKEELDRVAEEVVKNNTLSITMRDPRFISGNKFSLLALVNSIDQDLNL